MAEPSSNSSDALATLVATVDRLRSPGGCPWDAEQTHQSLVEYLVEETYEVLEAIETHDQDALREELGDLFLQVVLHSRIAQEDPLRPWGIAEVAEGLTAKLIRRHPHVFGDETVDSAAHVEERWQANKAAEKGRTSVVEGVPLAMPALTLARKLFRRARHAGITTDAPDRSVVQVAEQALATVGPDGLGDLLLALVFAGERAGQDAEKELRDAVRRYRSALIAAETSSPVVP